MALSAPLASASATAARIAARRRALAVRARACSGRAPRSASTLVIEGAGDGHGVGMSQDGALGYAQHGCSYSAILAHYYTGTALGQAPAGANVRVLVGAKVEQIPLERYVRGVVSAEMPASWPLAALEAQAVASRTYALTAHAGGSRFDVYSDTRSQVYRGAAAETRDHQRRRGRDRRADRHLRGQPAITYFFASSGGHDRETSRTRSSALSPSRGCGACRTPTKRAPPAGS